MDNNNDNNNVSGENRNIYDNQNATPTIACLRVHIHMYVLIRCLYVAAQLLLHGIRT